MAFEKVKIVMKTIPVVGSELKIQEWVTFYDSSTVGDKVWRIYHEKEFTLESGEPINWKFGNLFERCNGEKLTVENFVPYQNQPH